MDWIIQALLVILTNVQLIGYYFMNLAGQPQDAEFLFNLSKLLYQPDLYAEYPEGVDLARDRIRMWMGE